MMSAAPFSATMRRAISAAMRVGGRADFQDRALRCVRAASRASPRRCRRRAAGLVEADDALAPDAVGAHELPDRQRVEELVGDEEKRPVRHVVEARRARRFRRPLPPSVFCLARSQRRARLDQMRRRPRSRKSGALAATRRMSAISVPRPGPSSTSRTGVGRADHAPDMDEPRADDLAEHLAHLRRGDEIAVDAERIARRVVAVLGIAEAKRHVVGDAHRAVRLDERLDLLAERRVAHAGRAAFARSIAATPTSTIGIDSIMPMVRPPAKKPSCASGSRTNSIAMRARP